MGRWTRAFTPAGGTVAGRRHALGGRNSQDAFAWQQRAEGMVAVVADGCSSGAHSEAGALLGSRLAASILGRRLSEASSPSPDLARLLVEAEAELLERLDALVAGMAEGGGEEERRAVVGDLLLFTLVGALIAEEETLVFACGDGVVAVDGDLRRLGPFAEEQPPYLAYRLVGGPAASLEAIDRRPTATLGHLLLGSDGALDHDLALAEGEGPTLALLAGEDRFYRNPDALRRHLALLARRPGALGDDTTLLILRQVGGARAAGDGPDGEGGPWTSS